MRGGPRTGDNRLNEGRESEDPADFTGVGGGLSAFRQGKKCSLALAWGGGGKGKRRIPPEKNFIPSCAGKRKTQCSTDEEKGGGKVLEKS